MLAAPDEVGLVQLLGQAGHVAAAGLKAELDRVKANQLFRHSSLGFQGMNRIQSS